MNLNPNAGNQSSFLPQEYVVSKGQHRANIIALILFGAVSVGTIGAFVLNYKRKVDLGVEVREVRTEFEDATQRIDQLRDLETQRIEILEQAEVVTAIIERVPRSVLLAEIVRSLPDTAALTEATLDGKRIVVKAKPKAADPKKSKSVRGATTAKKDTDAEPKVLPPRFEYTITLTGLAAVNSDIADYLAAMKQSPLLAGVELQYINSTTVEETPLRKFRITMTIRNTGDLSRVVDAGETTLLTESEMLGITSVQTDTE